MPRSPAVPLVLLLLPLLAPPAAPTAPAGPLEARERNLSRPTLCAEEDNVNIPLFARAASFTVEARHPEYAVGQDDCSPDFTGCEASEVPFRFGDAQRVWKLFDDGVVAVEAVREPVWWRPRGMEVSVAGGPRLRGIHFIRLRRQVAGTDQYPEVLVLNMDGNLRLKPHPPAGRTDTCFGSSVIVGPAAPAARPIAEIEAVRYLPERSAFAVDYLAGGSAVLELARVDRELARLRVDVRYPGDGLALATLRSMYVAAGNADVDRVAYVDASGATVSEPVLDLPGGVASHLWRFYRAERSTHNTSAPDITIRELAVGSLCGEEATPSLCLRDQRFRVEVAWRDFEGGSGHGTPLRGASGESGIFWFFAEENWELQVKVLDGCPVNGRYWVFAAASTNVEHTLRVTDTVAGETVTYHNPPGRRAPAITDTGAFATCP